LIVAKIAMSTRVASWDIVFAVLVTLGMATSVEKTVKWSSYIDNTENSYLKCFSLLPSPY